MYPVSKKPFKAGDEKFGLKSLNYLCTLSASSVIGTITNYVELLNNFVVLDRRHCKLVVAVKLNGNVRKVHLVDRNVVNSTPQQTSALQRTIPGNILPSLMYHMEQIGADTTHP